MISIDGWIKLHRKLIDSLVFDNSDLLKVWIWCLVKATHKEYKQLIGMQEITLSEGQFIFGRKAAADELKMTESKIYRFIKKLESMKNISVKSNNKYSVVTVENWELYQGSESDTEQQMNNKRTTNEQQMNTNKNIKNKRTKEYIYKDIAEELVEPLKNFEEMRKKIRSPLTDEARTMLLNKLNKISGGDNQKAIAILNESTVSCWKGVYPLKENNTVNTSVKTNKFHNFQQQHALSEQEMEAIADKKNKEKLKKLGIGG